MATRSISTKLAISGESEYRASLSRINTELKTLQSSLKLTESQYQTNQNSMQALQAKHDALTKVQEAQRKKVEELRKALENARSAENTYAQKKEELKSKIEANNKALEKLKTATGDTAKEEAKLTEENAKLQKELAEVDSKLTAAEKGTNSWQTQLNGAQIQLYNLDAELEKNDKYLDEAKSSADGCATSIDEFGKQTDETTESVRSLGALLASEELSKFGKSIEEILTDCVKASMDFESSMAAVKRTTGMSDEEVKSLGEHFKTLSTEMPITTSELASIAANAGQLGIAKENVESFTTIMAQLATTTDLSAENASTMLAQFAAITGMDPADYDKLGSTVAALGDSSATTASKIVDMSQGIAGAASQAGMSESDILAISAAVGSIGIEAGAGSTAMSTLIQEIDKSTKTGGKKLDTFAKTSGMSSQEFVAAWKTDPASAMATFIEGLNDVERNGKSTVEILEELGITNVRQKRALIGLSEAGDLLSTSIEKGSQAWEENTALSEKAEIMYNTLEAKTTELESASNNLKIAVGDTLNPLLGDLAEKGTDILTKVTQFVQDHPQLTEALTLTAAGVAGVITAFAGFQAAKKAADFLGLLEPLEKIGEAATLAGGGISGLVTALGTIALPAAIAATAVAGVVAVVDEINTLETVGFLGEGHTLEEYAKNVEFYRAEIDRLKTDYDNLALYGGDLTMVQNQLDHATIGLQHATEEYTTAQENATEALEEAQEASTELIDQEVYQAAINESMAESIGRIAESYKIAYDACRESLEGQIGLFDDYAKTINEDTDTAKEMLDKWAAQTVNLSEYTQNLKRAAELGLDSGLVKSLADGSTESAGYLATILAEIDNCAKGTGTIGSSAEEAVKVFNGAFNTTSEAKDALAETMTAINTDLAASLAEMEEVASNVGFEGFWDAVDLAFKDVGVDFSRIGLDIGAGLSSGIEGSHGDVYAKSVAIIQAAIDAARTTADSHSPSKVFEGIGSDIDTGLQNGIENNADPVIAAVTKMGTTINTKMSQDANRAVTSFSSGLRPIVDSTQAILQNLSPIVSSTMSALPNATYIIGINTVYGMINGLYSASGALYEAMVNIVTNAMTSARNAAGVRSPSKITKEIFENVGEGMVVGIEAKKERVADATSDVIKNALTIDAMSIKQLSTAVAEATPDYGAIFADERRKATESADTGEHKNVTYNFDTTINTLPGQNTKEIANAVMDRILIEFKRKELSLT